MNGEEKVEKNEAERDFQFQHKKPFHLNYISCVRLFWLGCSKTKKYLVKILNQKNN